MVFGVLLIPYASAGLVLLIVGWQRRRELWITGPGFGFSRAGWLAMASFCAISGAGMQALWVLTLEGPFRGVTPTLMLVPAAMAFFFATGLGQRLLGFRP